MALSNQPIQGDRKEIQGGEPSTATHGTQASTPEPQPVESAPKDRRESVFGPKVTIEGTIEGNADVRIAGKFTGDIQIKGDLSIEKGAHLKAKISAETVTIAGELEGNIAARSQVKLLESGQLIGDLKATVLTVVAGSRMRGHVEFGWDASEMAQFAHRGSREKEKN
jgi:cytoskeletal protein CcmA (bactofilin family)